jgi:hypothetical protein
MWLILTPFFEQLTDEEISYRNYMQVNETAHIANNFMDTSDEVFGEFVVRWGQRPPRSSSWNPCVSHLWFTLKEKMYVDNPHSSEENIEHGISAVPTQQLPHILMEWGMLRKRVLSFRIIFYKILTYLRSWALLEKPPIVQSLKNFPAFYEPNGSLPFS